MVTKHLLGVLNLSNATEYVAPEPLIPLGSGELDTMSKLEAAFGKPRGLLCIPEGR